ncbi:MAG TPA: hypothetical protein VFZ65_22880 [Planctomycetota bacterium]|nr:hypothetical protein [Planctomycetota bacterium]
MPALEFHIDATRPHLRELAVSLEFDRAECTAGADPRGNSDAAGQVVLFLPNWTPGSYLIRDYSRHLSRVEACDSRSGEPIPCRKTSKNRYLLQVPATTARVRVSYRVYAHELSVRTADVTAGHAYWNHACVLLWPVGQPRLAAQLHIAHRADWAVACALANHAAPHASFAGDVATTTLTANDLDHVIDSPCLVGRFQRLEWQVDGVPHAAVLDGLAGVAAPNTLGADLGAIVTEVAAVFAGALPYRSYLFLCLFAGEGHGGLEHAESTTLLMSRTALTSPRGYREFLTLAAHELFHAWNVKRMRPSEFWQYDYENENYTELLWLIEGWTAYYDDLVCLRAGLMSVPDYLAALAKSINTMRASPGRHRLSLRESSFDAWIRLYRPDENSRNSSQNYYVHGSLAALCLDVLIRRTSDGTHSLDDVLRELYRGTFEHGRGYAMEDVDAAVRRCSGAETVGALHTWVGESFEPDLHGLLTAVGIRLVEREEDRPQLGIHFHSDSTKVASVQADTAAHEAGVAPGDELLAVQGLRVDAASWQETFQSVAKVEQPLELLLSRRGVITTCTAVPRPAKGTLALELDDAATPRQQQLRSAWLRQGPSSQRCEGSTEA